MSRGWSWYSGGAVVPVPRSGALGLLPLWMSCAARLLSSKVVPLTTGALSSKGLTESSKASVMYCSASHSAVLPSWSFSSRSSLAEIKGEEQPLVTKGGLAPSERVHSLELGEKCQNSEGD